MYDPILVTLIKMQPHYSQSSRENATPSSDTSPLAYSTRTYSPPPPPGGVYNHAGTTHFEDKQNPCAFFESAMMKEENKEPAA